MEIHPEHFEGSQGGFFKILSGWQNDPEINLQPIFYPEHGAEQFVGRLTVVGQTHLTNEG